MDYADFSKILLRNFPSWKARLEANYMDLWPRFERDGCSRREYDEIVAVTLIHELIAWEMVGTMLLHSDTDEATFRAIGGLVEDLLESGDAEIEFGLYGHVVEILAEREVEIRRFLGTRGTAQLNEYLRYARGE